MKIKKVLNNNAVIAFDGTNEDVVITGLGLAFKKKSGDVLEEEKIERIFRMENQEISRKLQELIRDIPVEYVGITEEIVVLVKEKLNKKVNENIYLTLTDHICFAVERIEKGYDVKNPLVWEVRRFYLEEYNIGLLALTIIKDKLGITLPKDEAASIAMHIVNAETDETMPNIVKVVKILQDGLNIIKYHFGVEFEEDSIHYQRLVTHLKFFAQRIINGEKDNSDEDSLFNLISKQYVSAFECAIKIKKYILERHNFDVQKAELTYLIVHIERVIQSCRKEA